MNIRVLRGKEASDPAFWALFQDRKLPFFQSGAFCSLWDDLPGYEAIALVAGEPSRPDGLLCGVLMRSPLHRIGSWLASRFICWGGPVIFGEDVRGITDSLLSKLVAALPRATVYAEFRNLSDQSNVKDVFLDQGFNYLPYLNLSISLAEGDPVAGIRPSRLRQARQAEIEGVWVRPAENESEWMAWYRILKNHYRRRVRKPLPEAAFFQHCSACPECSLLLAWHGNEIIGGIMLAGREGGDRYAWYIAGNRRIGGASSPMALLYKEAIILSKAEAYLSLDLMGGGIQDKPSGVRDYKMGFGPAAESFGRYILIRRPRIYNLARAWISFR